LTLVVHHWMGGRPWVFCLWLAAAACSAPGDPGLPPIDATGEVPDAAGVDVAADADVATGDVDDASSDAADLSVSELTSDFGRDMALDDGSDADVTVDLAPCVPSSNELQPIAILPQLLSETGLFDDIATGTLRPDIELFEPQFPLWSDGAVKTRWVWLPQCSTIDSSDPDHWVLPVGARFWKRFVVDGTTVETRFIHRFGPGPDDFLFGSYVWNDDDSDAVLAPSGEPNARGTSHDVPSIQACEACHTRLPERILGFGQIQLDHVGAGITLSDVAPRLTMPPTPFTPPGDATAQAALGHLHGNCGNCHNDTSEAVQFPGPHMSLRLSVSDTDVAMTGVGRTAIDVPVARFSHPQCQRRIDPGSSDTSCVPLRMELRGRVEQMPPIGTEVPDPTGLARVRAFIDAL